jgi:two-component system NarL family response regulator
MESAMQIDTQIRVHVAHSDPVVNIGLKALCGGLSGLDLCLEESDAPEELAERILISDYRGGLKLISQSESKKVRVLIITQCETEGEIRYALRAGIHGYLLQNHVLQDLEPAIVALSSGQRFVSAPANQTVANSLHRTELTRREEDVLHLLSKGHCNKLIARELGIAPGTVKAHLKSLLSKLDVSTRTQAVIVASQRGLLTDRVQAMT